MTVCTAGAAAAFGLVLATLSRTRQQLSGLANLLVLSLNALGGSMFPRFLMSEQLQKFSLVGFNAWALDGYLKVFWREAPAARAATSDLRAARLHRVVPGAGAAIREALGGGVTAKRWSTSAAASSSVPSVMLE